MVEGLGLDDAHIRLLLDAFGFGFPGVVYVPGPGLSVRVYDESLAGGDHSGGGLCFPGQAGCGLLYKFRILAVGLAGLIGVDLTLPVHCQEPIAMHADAGELGVPVCIEDGWRRLLAGPDVDALVGSECGLPSVAGCNLQVAEPVGNLGGEGSLLGCAVLRPGVDAPVPGQAYELVTCGLDTCVVRFLRVGRADGQTGAGGGPMIRAQRPVRGLRPLGCQCRVLEDRGPEVERLAAASPPVEPESGALRVLLRGSGEGAGFHGRLGGLAAVGGVEAHYVCGLIVRFLY